MTSSYFYLCLSKNDEQTPFLNTLQIGGLSTKYQRETINAYLVLSNLLFLMRFQSTYSIILIFLINFVFL